MEARKVAKGTTGQSTGNLYELTEYYFKKMQLKHDIETLKRALLSRREAMNLIDKNIRDLNIDCGYKRENMCVFQKGSSVSIKDENEITQEVNLHFSVINNLDFLPV